GPAWQLFDIAADPYEQHDLAAQQPELVTRLRGEYDRWFEDVGRPRGYAPPRIALGAPQENPTELTRQDWRGPRGGWDGRARGHWGVGGVRAGKYEVTVGFGAAPENRRAALRVAGRAAERPLRPSDTDCVFTVELLAGPARLEAELSRDGTAIGV